MVGNPETYWEDLKENQEAARLEATEGEGVITPSHVVAYLSGTEFPDAVFLVTRRSEASRVNRRWNLDPAKKRAIEELEKYFVVQVVLRDTVTKERYVLTGAELLGNLTQWTNQSGQEVYSLNYPV